MKLSELKKQLDQISKKAKKAKVDPEVQVAVLPKFPSAISLLDTVATSLNGDFGTETTGNVHTIYLGEKAEEGPIVGEALKKFGWDI